MGGEDVQAHVFFTFALAGGEAVTHNCIKTFLFFTSH
jgi:hypothetical protein